MVRQLIEVQKPLIGAFFFEFLPKFNKENNDYKLYFDFLLKFLRVNSIQQRCRCRHKEG